jgi:hypothetical protein
LLLYELQRLISQNVTLSASALASFAHFTPPLSPSSPVSDTFRMPIYNTSGVSSTLDSLNSAQHALVYDDDRESFDRNQDQYLFGNLCLAASTKDCESWQSGLMTLGLVSALLRLDTRVNAMLHSNLGKPMSFVAANASLYSPEVRFVREFTRIYASPSLVASLQAYVLSECISFQSLFNVRVSLLISLLAFVVLVFILFLYRRVHALNAESRRIGAIFLTIPTAVLDSMSKTANLQSLLEQIVSAQDDD